MVGDKEQLRDISSIGLKTVINELPLTTQSLAASVCKTMTGRLSAAIAQQEDVSVQLEALDILGDLLSRFIFTLLSVHIAISTTYCLALVINYEGRKMNMFSTGCLRKNALL